MKLFASVGGLPKARRAGEPKIAASAVVTLAKGVPVFLGPSPCPLKELPALVTSKV